MVGDFGIFDKSEIGKEKKNETKYKSQNNDKFEMYKVNYGQPNHRSDIIDVYGL